MEKRRFSQRSTESQRKRQAVMRVIMAPRRKVLRRDLAGFYGNPEATIHLPINIEKYNDRKS